MRATHVWQQRIFEHTQHRQQTAINFVRFSTAPKYSLELNRHPRMSSPFANSHIRTFLPPHSTLGVFHSLGTFKATHPTRACQPQREHNFTNVHNVSIRHDICANMRVKLINSQIGPPGKRTFAPYMHPSRASHHKHKHTKQQNDVNILDIINVTCVTHSCIFFLNQRNTTRI